MSPPETLAVLPFGNPGGDPQFEYLTSGIAEEIAGTLACVHALRVTASRTAEAAASRHSVGRDAAAELGVATVLEGSARKVGAKLQLQAQLVHVADGAVRWSQRYDRPFAELPAVQVEVVQEVVSALGAAATDMERRLLETPATTDVRAYDSYLQARRFSHQLLRRNQESARELFSQAIDFDGKFGAAYAGLATAHAMLFQYWDSSEENLQAAEAASAEAVSLDGRRPDPHVTRGLALSLVKRYDEAQAEFETAVAICPTSFDACYFLARSCRARGQYAEAAVWFERACDLRPDDYATPALLASCYVSLGRPDDARARQHRSLELAQQHLDRNPDDARTLYLGAGALATIGDTAKAREWAKRAIAMDPDDSAVLYNVACAYAILRLSDSAIDCLEQAIANGFKHWEWIEHDSDLDSLRQHPRFTALLAQR